jgi:hypothetical protein
MKVRRPLVALVLILFILSGCGDFTGATPTPGQSAEAPKNSTAPRQTGDPQSDMAASTPTAVTDLQTRVLEAQNSLKDADTPTPAPAPPPEPTEELGMIDIPSPTVMASEAPTATLVAQLESTVIAGVQPTTTPDATGLSPFGGIDSVRAFRLSGSDDRWIVYSIGSRNFDTDPPQKHFVAVYRHMDQTWKQVGRVEMDQPDYMSEGSVSEVSIEPTHTWLSVESGAGAHGGCFGLISFDGQDLIDHVNHCTSGPGAASVKDLDGDGQSEVVLNETENYVFCYACAVRLINLSVMKWTGSKLDYVRVEKLPLSHPIYKAKELNDQAVDLFNHGLFMQAGEAIASAATADPTDTSINWNRLVIDLNATARKDHVKDSGYPLLADIFYGDYAAAIEIMRPLGVETLFGTSLPLVAGTTAEGWDTQLTEWITSTTSMALEVEPNLAPAYFLRGWAYHLHDPQDSRAILDIDRAAQLAPQEPLFSEAAAYLKQR